MKYLHGSTELLDHMIAAQAYSEAKRALSHAQVMYMLMPDDGAGPALLAGAEQDVENARIALKAAYRLYTNPFNVQKTV